MNKKEKTIWLQMLAVGGMLLIGSALCFVLILPALNVYDTLGMEKNILVVAIVISLLILGPSFIVSGFLLLKSYKWLWLPVGILFLIAGEFWALQILCNGNFMCR